MRQGANFSLPRNAARITVDSAYSLVSFKVVTLYTTDFVVSTLLHLKEKRSALTSMVGQLKAHLFI